MAKAPRISMANLNAMTLAELKSLEKKLAKAVAKCETREKMNALSSLKAEAKKMGFSLDELTGTTSEPRTAPKRRKKVEPKYANPADTSQTWTGRGRRPAWVVEALEAGASMDDLTI